ncbi:hypothetical protein HYC85_000822 [Camellia sinensis]|uniref:Uncharacterized protein n=1 Tax=Camellia sinensis TaxID=4442 RepID=A0A7J7I3K9_CAMSI|nr:hypothetical protein HYC85_000822 [Camellia sinensis]
MGLVLSQIKVEKAEFKQSIQQKRVIDNSKCKVRRKERKERKSSPKLKGIYLMDLF